MKIRVCRAERRDLDQLVELSQTLNEYHQKWIPNLKPAPLVRKKMKLHYLKQMRSRKTLVLKAVSGKEIIGYAIAELKKKPPIFTQRDYAYLDSIFVSEAWRKKGVAKLLVREIEKWAKKRGANSLELKASSPNVTAITAYKKIGFSEKDKVMKKTLRPKK